VRLPRISGYLLTGALLGPKAFAVLRETHTDFLSMTDAACLAIIGVAAGAELHMADLRKHPRPTLVMTLCVSIFSFCFVFFAFLAVGPRVKFLKDLGTTHVAAIASLLGTLAIARSPASAIAVVQEMDARGPFCQHVMSVTVVKDALVVVVFALNVEAVAFLNLSFSSERAPRGDRTSEDGILRDAPSSMRTLDAKTAFLTFAFPFFSIFAAFLFGGVFGAVLGRATRPRLLCFKDDVRSAGDADRTASAFRGGGTGQNPPLSVKRIARASVIALLAGTAFSCADLAHLEPLLACVVAGATAANRTRFTGELEKETLRDALGLLTPAVNALFFTVIGSTIRFDRVFTEGDMCFAAVVIFAARLFGVFHASSFAKDLIVADASRRVSVFESSAVGYVPGCPPGNARNASSVFSFFEDAKIADHIWLAMITQAGVAMGLVRSCERRFPGWGEDFAALAAATIVLNSFVGPPAFRAAIVAAGESGAQRKQTALLRPDATSVMVQKWGVLGKVVPITAAKPREDV
jgi:Kef-type K+ transport system membrane component KefB